MMRTGTTFFIAALFICTFVSAERRFIVHDFFEMQTTFEAWTSWGPCSGPCGGTGVRQRTRGCHHKMMGFLEFTKECPIDGKETQTCVANCHQSVQPMTAAVSDVWSQWGQFSACDKTCGGGLQIRHRVCNSDTCFGDSLESAACNDHQCPVQLPPKDQQLANSKEKCGGSRYPQGYNNYNHQGGGSQVNTLQGSSSSSWSSWSSCSVTCGIGTHYRKQYCYPYPCPRGSGYQYNVCVQPCNGGWSSWSTYTCSKPCGGGVAMQLRSCTNPVPLFGGARCRGKSMTYTACNTRPCKVDGGWSSWQSPSQCNTTCGGGVRTRTRYCNHPAPAHGGQSCPGSAILREPCNSNPCPVDGAWSSWQSTSQCSAACGGGGITRTRYCNHPAPAHGGQTCPGSATRREPCNSNPCPVDGGWSSWQSTSQCSATCGGGGITRTRYCNHPAPAHGGQTCPGSATRREPCNYNPCPVDGGWSSWQSSSQCSATCGGGSRMSTRYCNHPAPAHGGQICPGSVTRREPCNYNPCPVPTTTTTTTTPAPTTTTTTAATTTTTTTPSTTTSTTTQPPTTTAKPTPTTRQHNYITIRSVLR